MPNIIDNQAEETNVLLSATSDTNGLALHQTSDINELPVRDNNHVEQGIDDSSQQSDIQNNNNTSNSTVQSSPLINQGTRRQSVGDRSRLSSISTPTRPWSVDLASTHSLHPQMDIGLNKNFMLMPINDQIRELQTVIRDKTTTRGNFKFQTDRLIRLVIEEGLNQLPIEKINVKTPTGYIFNGIRYLKGNCGVSIVRSGESMEQGLRDCCRSIRIGKILIESDENHKARVLYEKLPVDIANRRVLLLYPILSTGFAIIESVKLLIRSYGVKEENIILLNLFSSPRAAKLINQTYPKMFVLTSDVNKICPNHFGHRYFGTD